MTRKIVKVCTAMEREIIQLAEAPWREAAARLERVGAALAPQPGAKLDLDTYTYYLETPDEEVPDVQ